jgi:hypothetical protein
LLFIQLISIYFSSVNAGGEFFDRVPCQFSYFHLLLCFTK